MNTTSLPTLEQLATFFDEQPARVRELSRATLRSARAFGWMPTIGFNTDLLEVRSAIRLERNEGACNYEAACLDVFRHAESWAAFSPSLSVERWRLACLDELQVIVDGFDL